MIKNQYNLIYYYEIKGKMPERERLLKKQMRLAEERRWYQTKMLRLTKYIKAEQEDEKFVAEFNYFKRAANSGDPIGMLMLGNCYYYGYGTEKDYNLAVKYYEKAFANRKNVDEDVCRMLEYNMLELGICYSYGYGAEPDEKKVLKWYEISANAGNNEAKFKCGQMYKHGYSVDGNKICDMKKAIEYFTDAAESGHISAMETLGDYYSGYTFHHHAGFKEFYDPIDAKKGFEWYKKANSKYKLAHCYYEGVGVEANLSKGIELLEGYAASGYTLNNYELDGLYEYYSSGGTEGKRKLIKAAKWKFISLWERR